MPDPDGDVEHGDRLVGEYELGPQHERLGETDPLALAAAQLVGVLGQHRLGGLEADGVHHPERLVRGAPNAAMSGRCKLDGPHDPVRDPVGGVDRAVRVLEDHGDMAAVRQLLLPPVEGAEGLALEAHLPAVGL